MPSAPQGNRGLQPEGGPSIGPAVRMRPAWGALILVATLLFLWLYATAPRNMLRAVEGALLLVPAAVLLRHGSLGLLYVAPLVFSFGGADIGLGHFHPTFATLFCFAVTILWLLEKIVRDESFRIPWKAGLGVCLMAAAVQTVSIALSVHVCGQHVWNAIREGWSLFLFMPLALVTVDRVRTGSQALWLVRSIVLSLLVTAASGIFEYLGIEGFSRIDIELGYVYRGRVDASFPGANVFAGFLELTVPVALGLALHEKSRAWRTLSLAAFAAGFAATLFTFSRGGFLMTVLGSVLVLAVRFRRRPALPAAFLALIVYVMASNAHVFARQLSLVTEPSDVVNQPTLVHRYITYRSFWNDFLDRPWTGVGWGALGFFTGRTQIYTFWDIRHTISTSDIPHFGGGNSLFLNQAVKGGIVSLVSLALLVAGVTAAAVFSMRRGRSTAAMAMVCSLVGFAGHQLVDHLLRWPQINAFFWLGIGTMISLSIPEDPASPEGVDGSGLGGIRREG